MASSFCVDKAEKTEQVCHQLPGLWTEKTDSTDMAKKIDMVSSQFPAGINWLELGFCVCVFLALLECFIDLTMTEDWSIESLASYDKLFLKWRLMKYFCYNHALRESPFE